MHLCHHSAFQILHAAPVTRSWVLARATNGMAKATSAANVVASLEPNQWTFSHLDVVVHNTGNAPAYEVKVKVKFDPPPLHYWEEMKVDRPPFGKISILRPGQIMSCTVNERNALCHEPYRVLVQWKRKPDAKPTESNSYEIGIALLSNLAMEETITPEVKIAQQVQKIREDWVAVAKGNQRIKTDQFSSGDCAAERDTRLTAIRQARQEAAKDAVEKSAGNDS